MCVCVIMCVSVCVLVCMHGRCDETERTNVPVGRLATDNIQTCNAQQPGGHAGRSVPVVLLDLVQQHQRVVLHHRRLLVHHCLVHLPPGRTPSQCRHTGPPPLRATLQIGWTVEWMAGFERWRDQIREIRWIHRSIHRPMEGWRDKMIRIDYNSFD